MIEEKIHKCVLRGHITYNDFDKGFKIFLQERFGDIIPISIERFECRDPDPVVSSCRDYDLISWAYYTGMNLVRGLMKWDANVPDSINVNSPYMQMAALLGHGRSIAKSEDSAPHKVHIEVYGRDQTGLEELVSSITSKFNLTESHDPIRNFFYQSSQVH